MFVLLQPSIFLLQGLQLAGAADEACSSEVDGASLLQSRTAKKDLEMPVVKDVKKSFREIQTSPVMLIAPVGDRLPPNSYTTTSQHMQGVQRLQKSSYFAVSGNSEESEVLFFHVGADTTNEPLASNLGQTSSEAKLVNVLKIEKELSHAGGISAWGNYLVVGVEMKCPISNWCGEASRVYFYDVSDPEKPKQMTSVIERPDSSAGATAMVDIDGGFLVVVGGWDSEQLDFYESSDLNSVFSKTAIWNKKELLAAAGMDTEFGKYQNLNIVKQADGKLFLVGTTHDGLTPGVGHHWADLFSLEYGNGKRVSIKKVASRQFDAKESDFQAGAGLFVADEERLMLYSVPFNLKQNFVVFDQFS